MQEALRCCCCWRTYYLQWQAQQLLKGVHVVFAPHDNAEHRPPHVCSSRTTPQGFRLLCHQPWKREYSPSPRPLAATPATGAPTLPHPPYACDDGNVIPQQETVATASLTCVHAQLGRKLEQLRPCHTPFMIARPCCGCFECSAGSGLLVHCISGGWQPPDALQDTELVYEGEKTGVSTQGCSSATALLRATWEQLSSCRHSTAGQYQGDSTPQNRADDPAHQPHPTQNDTFETSPPGTQQTTPA